MAERVAPLGAAKARPRRGRAPDILQPVVYTIPFADETLARLQMAPSHREQLPAAAPGQDVACSKPARTITKKPSQKRKNDPDVDGHPDGGQKDGEDVSGHRLLKTGQLVGDFDGGSPRRHGGATKRHRYTDIYKASLRLKGLRLERIFAKSRAPKRRPDGMAGSPTGGAPRHGRLPEVNAVGPEAGGDRRARSTPRDESELDFDDVDVGMPTLRSARSLRPSYPGDVHVADLPWLTALSRDRRAGLSTVIDSLVTRYEDTPGRKVKVKERCGRKLGNIVSSERLHQLLDSKQPLKMENFYNYYP